MSTNNRLIIIGGGLAGSEAAWQAANQDIDVLLYEMRPTTTTSAHQTAELAELVCSNSLGSYLLDRASGTLKYELRRLGSMLLECAEATSLPAGSALAVDRSAFAHLVTERIHNHPHIEVRREEITRIPSGTTIIATGPLTSERLSQAIAKLTGTEHLFFYDAIAPIISRESIDMSIAFPASRYSKGERVNGDYINCPLNKNEYLAFVRALREAEHIKLHDFERQIEDGVRAGTQRYFEGCLPVEIIAQRGEDALAFGPMRPVGLTDPRTGKRPHAVLQLRQDNLAGSLYNMVGFQTNLTYSEQCRVFALIPGLEKAEFVRFGEMHRNTFIASPVLLNPTLQFRGRTDLFFSGQITGVEGYLGNIATGLLAGWNAARLLTNKETIQLPHTTLLGALCKYITHVDIRDFQPMKANYGILPPLENTTKMNKRQRAEAYAKRSLVDLEEFLSNL